MNLDTVINLLRHAEPWNALPEQAWPELREDTRLVSMPKHQVVFHQVEQGRGVFFVASGLVKLSKSALEGKDTVIFLAQAGDTVGEQILGAAGCYACRAQTLSDCILVEINADWVAGAAQQNPLSAGRGAVFCSNGCARRRSACCGTAST